MELIVVVAIIGILSGTAYIGIQKGKTRMYNDKVLDDVTGIANALERYNHDHWGEYPVPDVDGNMNISCFYADATYAHDCDTSAFRQGMIDSNLLTRRYMPEVPTDPRTGSRYVYGVSTDGKYFMVGGNYEESSGSFVAKTAGNLKKGYHLPSLIRAFNGPNFVVEDGTNLPYSPDHLIISAKLQNMSDSLSVTVTDADTNPVTVTDGMTVYTGYTITTTGSTLDIYYSDGSISNLDTGSSMEILEGTEVEENDEDGIITKIRIKLTSGKIWNKVARLASASEFNVETTTAIAGVRGTEFGVDANTDQVLLKNGEICRMDLVEGIPVENVKTCTGSHTIAGLDDTAGPVIIGMDAGGTATADTPTTEPLKTLMDEQTKRYLNDNIRPHILKVDGLTITVANLRTYYGITGDDYSEAEFLAAFEMGGDPTGDSISIAPSDNDDYVLTLTSATSTPIVLRFEDVGGPSSGDSIPITVTLDTNITEEDLYAVDEEIGEGVAEEAIGCTAADMMISGDVTFAESTAPDSKDATLVWSVAPPECFSGATYAIVFDSETPVTGLTETHFAKPGLANGIDYTWSLTASTDYGEIDFSETTFTVPATPTWCGDGEYDPINEECDASNVAYEEGCNAPGPDECTCNIDLGWDADSVSGGCVCDDSTKAISLITTGDVPINGSLMWEVSPACAFEGALYNIQIGTTPSPLADAGISDTTTFSLTDAETSAPELMPEETYHWGVGDGTGMPTTGGTFTVECPTTGTITLTTPEASASIESSDLGSTNFTWNPADPECYFDSSDDYHFEIWLDGDTSSVGACGYSVATDATSQSVTLDSTCTNVLDEGAYIWKVIRNNNSSVQQVYERSFTVTAPATPAPDITLLAIDCSGGSWDGHCMSGSDDIYDVNFTVTDATSCTANNPPSLITLPTPSGGPGSVSAVSLTGNDGSFVFDTAGTESFNTIQITVECDNGVGGTDTEYLNVPLE